MTSVDLHLHTTASDGRCAPDELVRRAHMAGIRVISVTDHDTRAGEAAARVAAAELQMELISGIEITAVFHGRDVHVLGYGLPPDVSEIDTILAAQRCQRIDRAREIAERLFSLGAPIDIDALMAGTAASGKAIARPQIAQCLIAAGHVLSIAEAFDRYLNDGGPAYVPHQGASPEDIVALVGKYGGIASLAHPGRLGRDELIPVLAEAGLPCIEAYHSSHDAETTDRYRCLARRYGLTVTGGSDFHGDGTRYAELFGVVGLPADEFAAFKERLDAARGASVESLRFLATKVPEKKTLF